MTESGRDESWPEGGREFRLARWVLVMGLGGLVLFGGFGAVSVFAALVKFSGELRYRVLAAIVFGCFWSFFSLLASYLLLAYFRERLFVTARSLRAVGCFRTREVDLGTVVRVVWKCEGTVVLHDASGKVALNLVSYRPSDRAEIVRFLRVTLPEEIQEGWETCERYALPYDSEWPRHRRRGRRHYVWVQGVLVGLGFISTIGFRQWLWGKPVLWDRYLVLLAVSGLGGYLVGVYRWRTKEAEFRSQEQAGDL